MAGITRFFLPHKCGVSAAGFARTFEHGHSFLPAVAIFRNDSIGHAIFAGGDGCGLKKGNATQSSHASESRQAPIPLIRTMKTLQEPPNTIS